MLRTSKLFSVRMLGFGFFWAWLFLVAVSPSPLFGQLTGPGGTPFELWELCFRLLALVAVGGVARQLATTRGVWVLAVLSAVFGIAGVAALGLAQNAGMVAAAALFVGVADTCMFVGWLSFFGYLRLGETALLIALSYAVGSVVLFALYGMGKGAMQAASVLLPVASAVSFVLAYRSFAQTSDAPEPWATSADASKTPLPPVVYRLYGALAALAALFALFSCVMVRQGVQGASGPLVQAGCCIVIACIVGAVFALARQVKGMYGLYRLAPLAMGAGFCCLGMLGGQSWTAAGGLVMFGFLTFEILSLNDFCNAVKTNDASLVRAMTGARVASSAGMLAGWGIGMALPTQTAWADLPGVAAFVGVLGVLVVGFAVFTNTEVVGLRDLSGDRAAMEKLEDLDQRDKLLDGFAQAYGLSGREREVMGYLLSGRNAVYIAEQLVIAESTARTYIHKIYQKTETHARMELLDVFDAFCAQQGSDSVRGV